MWRYGFKSRWGDHSLKVLLNMTCLIRLTGQDRGLLIPQCGFNSCMRHPGMKQNAMQSGFSPVIKTTSIRASFLCLWQESCDEIPGNIALGYSREYPREYKTGISRKNHMGKATASVYSFFNISRKALRPDRLSSLWVQRTQEKLSLQSKGIQANWPL